MLMIVLNSVFLFFLILSYIIYSSVSVLFMFIVRFILFFNHRISHNFTMRIKILWLSFTVTTLGLYFIHPIYIYYNKKLLTKKRCLVLSNHLTNFDWIYILLILEKLGMYEDLIIISKESLKNIPIFGYGMRAFGYIFLKREWSVDREILGNGLRSLSEKKKFFLLLFPEGTLIDTETHKKSIKYCSENRIKLDGETFNPNQVLLPRKTGFEMIYDNLNTHIDGIVDFTLLITPYKNYPSEEFTFYDIFIKRSKRMNICSIINFIDLKTRRDDNWIYEIFKVKNQIIEKYAQSDKFQSPNEFKMMVERNLKMQDEFNTKEYELEVIKMWYTVSPIFCLMQTMLVLVIFYFIGKGLKVL